MNRPLSQGAFAIDDDEDLIGDGPSRFTISMFRDVNDTSPREIRVTLKELRDRIADAWCKPEGAEDSSLAGPLIKLTTFDGPRGGDAETTITGVELDVDETDMKPEEAAARLLDAGIRAIVHTTRKHGLPGKGPRWRVLAPVSRPLAPSFRKPLVRALATALDVDIDEASVRPAQGMFIAAPRGSERFVRIVDGAAIDLILSVEPEPEAEEAPTVDLMPVEDVTDWHREWLREKLAEKAAEVAAAVHPGRHDGVNTAIWYMARRAAHPGTVDRKEIYDAIVASCRENGLIPAGAKAEREERALRKFMDRTWRAGVVKPAELPEDPDRREARLTAMLPDLPEKPTADDLETQAPLFEPVAAWYGQPVPPRNFLVDGWLPAGTVTSLYGDGGLGKSLLALQLAAAVATGGMWCGRPVTRGKAMVVAAEDDRDELHRRMAAIARATDSSLDEYGDLLALSLADRDATLAAMDPKKGGVRSTGLYKQIKQAVDAEKPALLVLDTLGNLFSGNENDRAQVTQFVALLRNLAVMHGTAVLLLAHPSKTGMASGSGDSGSTGWNGTVRSRLYLDRVLVEGKEIDPNLRRMSHLKANYGPRLDPVDLRYEAGAFHLAPGAMSEAETKIQARFLDLVDRHVGQALNTVSGPRYAPNVFSLATGGDVTKKQFTAAMRALLDLGTIEECTVRTQDRKMAKSLRRVVTGDPVSFDD